MVDEAFPLGLRWLAQIDMEVGKVQFLVGEVVVAQLCVGSWHRSMAQVSHHAGTSVSEMLQWVGGQQA